MPKCDFNKVAKQQLCRPASMENLQEYLRFLRFYGEKGENVFERQAQIPLKPVYLPPNN